MAEKRNIVLITLDSLRADHCSFMGYHRKTTPTLDRMAKEGLFFENAIAAAVATLPSMFAVFTGNYLLDQKHEKEIKKELKNCKTLAYVLSRKGYKTAAFHANPLVSRFYGFDKGFDYFEDFLPKENRGQAPNFIGNIASKLGLFSFLNSLFTVINKDTVLTSWDKIYPHVIKWVKSTKKPYFIWILLIDTHFPYLPPKKFRKFSSNFTPYLLYLNWKIKRNPLNPNISSRERENIINSYDDSIYWSDKFIEELWSDLKDDDPIFIIHADHGEGFGEHGFYFHHRVLYEELIHVPLVIYNSGIKNKVRKPISLLGLASTILEIIGEENVFASESFMDGGKDWVISKVFEGSQRKIAVRMEDWKFITGQKNEDELYYLKKDPYEQENLINDCPELVKEMRKIVEIHVKQEIKRKRIRDRVSRSRVRFYGK